MKWLMMRRKPWHLSQGFHDGIDAVKSLGNSVLTAVYHDEGIYMDGGMTITI